jgi:glyceraldehyde 3-phosphate dehydrogenase
MTKVAINGFGRIGRLVARGILERRDCGIELVGVNDLADPQANAWRCRNDSVHGKFAGDVTAHGNDNIVDGKRIHVTAEKDPAELPHAANAVEIALECTGFFTDREGGEKHLKAGAKRVLISAPAKGADLTVVYGVNDDKLTPQHKIVSNGSCTTNCLAPVAKVLNDALGIERGLSRTIHGYTAEQALLDRPDADLRRGRSALTSIIPLATSSPRAVGEILPELKGKLDGSAVRIPVPNVSLIELTFVSKARTSREQVNWLFRCAVESGRFRNILGVSTEPFISSDLNHSAQSAIVDLNETKVVDGKLVRVVTWYDNEWGYANRVIDTAGLMAAQARTTRPIPFTAVRDKELLPLPDGQISILRLARGAG